MRDMSLTLDQLRAMIGLRLRLRGQAFRVIEVIEDQTALVLEPESPDARDIQADAYGQARRHAREIVMVPVFNADRTGLHEEFLEIDLP